MSFRQHPAARTGLGFLAAVAIAALTPRASLGQAATILTGAPSIRADTISFVALDRLVPRRRGGDVAAFTADSARVEQVRAAIRSLVTPERSRATLETALLEDPDVRAYLLDPSVPAADKRLVLATIRAVAVAATRPDPASYWAGAQLAYAVNGDGTIADNLQVAGHLAVQSWAPPVDRLRGRKPLAWLGRFEVPFYTNISRPGVSTGDSALAIARHNTQQLLSGAEGIHFGVMPFMRWPFAPKGQYFAEVYGSAAWRVNTVRAIDTTKTVNLEQTRVAGGLRLGIGHFKIGSAPGQLTVEYFDIRFRDAAKYRQAFGEDRAPLYGIETNLILPLGDQLAVLVNHTKGRNARADAFLRLGLVIKRDTGA